MDGNWQKLTRESGTQIVGVPVGQIQSIWYRRKAKKLSYKMHKVNCKNKLIYLLVDRRIGQAKAKFGSWCLTTKGNRCL
jgi:hypothetical protein